MDEFEYVIVGSGVAGATIAKALLEHDPKTTIAIVEAGPVVPLKDRRRWWDFVSTRQNPYDQYHDLESENESLGKTPWGFKESRLMGRGGSTVHWGGWALRFKEEDFELCSRTGRGADWPFGYDELEPYYCRAEAYLGVSGDSADPSVPRSQPYPNPPFPYVMADRPMIEAFQRLDIGYGQMPMARFRKCMTTGTCRYCPFGSRFTAAYVLDELQDRFENFELFTDSPAVSISLTNRGRVEGVDCVSTLTGESFQVRGMNLIVCSGAYESPKLLLRSTSHYWERGIGNDHDQLGRYLVSHPFLRVRAALPSNSWKWNQELDFPTLMSRHYDSSEQQASGKLFLFKDRSRPSLDLAEEMIKGRTRGEINRTANGPMEFELQGFMEEFGSYTNRVELSDETNRFGLPQTKVTFSRNPDFEPRMESRLDLMETVIREMGLVPAIRGVRSQRGDHSASTCRMGQRPEDSVVDGDLRVHDFENLFICSNAVFPNGAAVNPTLTLTALSFRLADYLIHNT